MSEVGDMVENAVGEGVDALDVGYVLTQENQWGWITLYVVTITLAILLNLLFIVGGLCTRRTRTTGYYLLLNLSVRDILVAALCVPFTLDSEIIALTWNYGYEYCIAYRFFYHCFLAFLPLTLLFLAWHLFVENCKWNFAGEGGSVPRPWPHTIYLPLIWFFSAAYAVPTVFFSDVRDEADDLYRNDVDMRTTEAQVRKKEKLSCPEKNNFGKLVISVSSSVSFLICESTLVICSNIQDII